MVLDGLTNQLLGVIVRSEDPRLEEDKNRLLFQVAKGCMTASNPRGSDGFFFNLLSFSFLLFNAVYFVLLFFWNANFYFTKTGNVQKEELISNKISVKNGLREHQEKGIVKKKIKMDGLWLSDQLVETQHGQLSALLFSLDKHEYSSKSE